jgi:phosphotransferase system enzyme I (PtsP)
MVASQFPRMEAQVELYKSVMDATGGRPVTFRTLDIGGDKILPYMQAFEEENPALGWRAIRIGLDRPGLLRSQLRALLRAGSGRDMRIMFPMVSDVSEFIAAKEMVGRELRHLERHGYTPPSSLKLGIMLEVPSVLWQLDEIFTRVDFVSIGSNDLFQYVFAADRDNRRMAHRFEPMSRPFLRVIKQVVDHARAVGKPVTLCGEIGGSALDAMALIGIGLRGLSMTASSIGPVKAMVLALDEQDLRAEMTRLMAQDDGTHSLRAALRAYAEAKGVPL